MSTFLSFYIYFYILIYHLYSRRFQRCARHLMDVQSPLWEQLPLIRHFPRQHKNIRGKKALSLAGQKTKETSPKNAKGTNPSRFPEKHKKHRKQVQKTKGVSTSQDPEYFQCCPALSVSGLLGKNMCSCLNSNTLTICNLYHKPWLAINVSESQKKTWTSVPQRLWVIFWRILTKHKRLSFMTSFWRWRKMWVWLKTQPYIFYWAVSHIW